MKDKALLSFSHHCSIPPGRPIFHLLVEIPSGLPPVPVLFAEAPLSAVQCSSGSRCGLMSALCWCMLSTRCVLEGREP